MVNKCLLTLLMLMFFSGHLLAQENDKSQKGGYGIQLGVGPEYSGGIGILLEYENLLKENLRTTPLISVGTTIGGTDSSASQFYWLNFRAGLNFEYGRIHRIIFGPQLVGCFDVMNKPADASIVKKILVGPSFIAGYKGVAPFGLIWQFCIGAEYIQNPVIADDKYTLQPGFGLGTGYKF
jgi:hypothetical protein